MVEQKGTPCHFFEAQLGLLVNTWWPNLATRLIEYPAESEIFLWREIVSSLELLFETPMLNKEQSFHAKFKKLPKFYKNTTVRFQYKFS